MDLAKIYDKLIDINYDDWIKFVEEYFKDRRIEIRGKSALELGCGTGNMTMRLKEKGMEVTATDISNEMLSLAQEKALDKRYKINFLNQDMADFELNRKFGFVFSFCDGYNYVTGLSDVENSFNRVFNHLDDSGIFMFDISTRHKLMDVIGNNTYTMNEEDLCYIWDNYYDDNILEMYITFFVKEGELYKRIEETHIQMAHDVNDLKELLLKTGFKNVTIFEDYSFRKLNDKSMRATFIAEK